jgi:hypothetical protein
MFAKVVRITIQSQNLFFSMQFLWLILHQNRVELGYDVMKGLNVLRLYKSVLF